MFVISNPINIVAAQLFDISFAEYVAWMFIPAVFSIVVSYLGLRIYFRRHLPTDLRPLEKVTVPPQQKTMMRLCAVVLAVTLLLLTCESIIGLPTWAVTSIAALVLVVAHQILCGGKASVFVWRVGWDVIFFIVGIYIVAVGVRNVGLAERLGTWLSESAGDEMFGFTTLTAMTAGLLSAIMNNHPTVDTMSFAIRDLQLPVLETKLVVFAAVIGGDLGPKMLPTGSLAALMWFRILRNRGVEIPYGLYVKIGIPVTLSAILIATLVLNLEYMIYQSLH